MIKLLKSQMNPKATFESLVRDTILNPTDKINLPNREASQLRSTQQLSRWDDSEFLDLGKDSERIMKEKIHQEEFTQMTGHSGGLTRTVEQAAQPPAPPPENFQPQPPPPTGPPRFTRTPGSYWPRGETASTQTDGQGKPPPPPPPAGVKMSAASAQTTEMFDMTMDDDMEGIQQEYEDFRLMHAQMMEENRRTIKEIIHQNLGPHSNTADQSFISRLTEMRNGRRAPGV